MVTVFAASTVIVPPVALERSAGGLGRQRAAVLERDCVGVHEDVSTRAGAFGVSVKMPLPAPSMRIDWAGLLLLPCTAILPAFPEESGKAPAPICPPLRTVKFWVSTKMMPAVPWLDPAGPDHDVRYHP